MKAFIGKRHTITIPIDSLIYGEIAKAKDWVDEYCKTNGYYLCGCLQLLNALQFEVVKLEQDCIEFD